MQEWNLFFFFFSFFFYRISIEAITIIAARDMLLTLYVTFHAQLWPRTRNLLLLIFPSLMILIKRHS